MFIQRFTPFWKGLLFSVFLASFAFAETNLDIYTGTSAYQISELLIRQAGHEDVLIEGVRYRTEPWTDFPNLTGNYYGLRLGYFSDASPNLGFELEYLHSKAIYDSGIDPENIVRHFEVTDGMNFLMGNLVYRFSEHVSSSYPQGAEQLLIRAGIGPTISKPASTIRGLHDGYIDTATMNGFAFAGVGGQLSVQLKTFAQPWLSPSFEYKLTYVNATVAVAEGSVVTPLAASHFVFGLSFSF